VRPRMSDIGDMFCEYRKDCKQAAWARRLHADHQFAAARDAAAKAGLTLRQHCENHYSLVFPGGAQLNIWPGTQHLKLDPNRPKPPYLDFGTVAERTTDPLGWD
jgi:hypothetical protein